MLGTNEAFSRVLIDRQLADEGWDVTDPNAVPFEYSLMAVVEAQRFSMNPGDTAEQTRAYAKQLNVPYDFLSNGSEFRLWEREGEAAVTMAARLNTFLVTARSSRCLPRGI